MICIGCMAFALFFLSDINDLALHEKRLVVLFPAGGLLLVLACLFSLNMSSAPLGQSAVRTVVWLAFAAFTALEIYTLFFAIPAKAGYTKPGEPREVCTTGVYALCRHPGVLWLALAFFCLSLCAGLPYQHGVVYTVLNTALVTFEDLYVFPRLMRGYDTYKRSTPFLIPTAVSIRSFLENGNTSD